MSTNTPQDGGVSAPMPSETLPMDDARFRSWLGGMMEVIRACDQQVGEDGLCSCARSVGNMLRMAMHHGDNVVKALERTITESDAWRRKYIELRAAHQERDADARRLDWLEGMSATAEHHSGHWFLSWPVYAGGPDPAGSAHEQGLTLRAAIDAAMAADTRRNDDDVLACHLTCRHCSHTWIVPMPERADTQTEGESDDNSL